MGKRLTLIVALLVSSPVLAAPKCVKDASPDDVSNYVASVMSMTEFIHKVGMDDTLSQSVPTGVLQTALTAMDPMKAYAAERTSCLALSKPQIRAMLTLVGGEAQLMNEQNISSSWIYWVRHKVSGDQADGMAAAMVKMKFVFERAAK